MAVFSGIGYQLADADPICGIDLDKCLDPETGEVQDWAVAIVQRLQTTRREAPAERGFASSAWGSFLPDGGAKAELKCIRKAGS